MKVRLFSLTSGLHAEAMSDTARDPFVREVLAALSAAAPALPVEVCGAPAVMAGPSPVMAGVTGHLDLLYIRTGEYDTHFESGIGVAVRGELPEGPVTILKVSPDLQQCFAADATLLRNTAERDLCRTQVVLRAPGTARYFLTDSIGNHHIIIPGHHGRQLSGKEV